MFTNGDKIQNVTDVTISLPEGRGKQERKEFHVRRRNFILSNLHQQWQYLENIRQELYNITK